jgi:hypothetical protein
MKDFLDKLQDFLFDILGLILPGFVFICCLFVPIYLFDFSKIQVPNQNQSSILTLYIWLSKQKVFIISDSIKSPLLIFLFSYIMGHLVKVFSIIQYDIFTSVFDKFLNKIFILLYNLLGRVLRGIVRRIDRNNNLLNSIFYKSLLSFFSPIKDIARKIFTFKSPDYFKDNETLRTESVNLLNQKLSTTFPSVWYSLYKFSTVLAIQENIKSLAGNFLAKYNLYRSLSFTFLFSAILFYCFFTALKENHFYGIAYLEKYVLILTTLLWFSFHVKYKRYWTLCGNETLVSLYYYLNKSRII